MAQTMQATWLECQLVGDALASYGVEADGAPSAVGVLRRGCPVMPCSFMGGKSASTLREALESGARSMEWGQIEALAETFR